MSNEHLCFVVFTAAVGGAGMAKNIHRSQEAIPYSVGTTENSMGFRNGGDRIWRGPKSSLATFYLVGSVLIRSRNLVPQLGFEQPQ